MVLLLELYFLSGITYTHLYLFSVVESHDIYMEKSQSLSVRASSLSPIDPECPSSDSSAIAESPALSNFLHPCENRGFIQRTVKYMQTVDYPEVVDIPIDNDHVHFEDDDECAQLIDQSLSTNESTNDNEENGTERKENDHPHTSILRTFFNFVKGNIGTGILAMPDAVKNAGLFFGTGSILLIGMLCTYCCHQLLHAYRQVADGKPMGYAAVMELSFQKAQRGYPFRKLSTAIRYTVDLFLIFNQLGLCCVYFLFTSRMIKEVVDSSVPGGHSPNIHVYITIMLAVLIPYCLVTTLKVLSVFSLLGNLLSFVSLGIVLQLLFRELEPIEDVDWVPSKLSKLPLFFGTAMFAFESVALILPMENRMKERQAFHGWNGLLSFSMYFVISLYCIMGFYGYLAFGVDAKMILSNMPTDSWLYNSARIMYSITVFISFNLQMYVPVQIMFPAIKKFVNRPWFDRIGEYFFRTSLVILTYALAVGIPCLEYMISLIGAMCSASLAIIFPPLVELAVGCHPENRLTYWMILKNSVIFAIGVFGCVAGTFVSIQHIVSALSSSQGCEA